jgi:Tfp pilus assembly protein PilX
MEMQRQRESGSALVLVMGVVATLAILAATVVMVTANVQGSTAADRTKTKAFDAAEAALDQSMYRIGMSWPATASSFAWDSSAFNASFLTAGQTAEYPGLTTTVTVSAGPTSDKYWITAQARVGTWKACIRTQVQKQSIAVQTLAPGVAVYSGGAVTMTGSAAVTGPTSNGQPTAALYAGTKVDVSGGNPSITASIFTPSLVKQAWQTSIPTPTSATVPSIDQFFPQSLIDTLTSASRAAPNTGTLVSNSTPGFSSPWGVNFSGPCHATADLHVNTEGTYNFGTLYVNGSLLVDGNAAMNCTALYVTGNLTVANGAHTQSFGPTYVGGNVSFTGNQRFDIPLLVTQGAVTIANSQLVGGNGVSPNPKPCMLVMTGANKTFSYTGNCQFTGVVANMGGGTTDLTIQGSNAIRGAVFTRGPVELSGTGSVAYDPTVVGSFTSNVTTAAKIVSGTWQEVKPL